NVLAFKHKEAVKCKLISITDVSWTRAELEKVILIGDIAKIEALWSNWSAQLQHNVELFQSEANYMELVASGTSKGHALERLSEMLNIDKQNIMAIGNQMNDLPMLQAAGVGVAVANSPEELKSA